MTQEQKAASEVRIAEALALLREIGNAEQVLQQAIEARNAVRSRAIDLAPKLSTYEKMQIEQRCHAEKAGNPVNENT